MSTRAIIALPESSYDSNAKYGYRTAWCWNDGGKENLGADLKKFFKTEEDVKQLIALHSFSSMQSPKEIADFISNGYLGEGDKVIFLKNSICVISYKQNGKVIAGAGRNGYFDTVEEMLGQDLNFVYVFENGKWKTYN